MRFSGIAVAGVVLSCAATAVAQDLGPAQAHYAEARFDEARAAFEEVLRDPQLGPRTAAEANLYLALLEAVLGRPERVDAHVLTALRLDPRTTVPPGASPEFTGRVEELRAGVRGGAELVMEPVAPGGLALKLVPGIPTLVTQLKLTCTLVDGRSVSQAGGPAGVTVRVPRGGRIASCTGVASTDAGAALFEATRDLAPLDTRAAPRSEEGGFPTVLVLTGVVVAVVAAVGVGVALSLEEDTARVGGATVDRW